MQFVFKNEHRYFSAVWPYSTRKLLGEQSLSVQCDPTHMQRRKLLRQAFAPKVLAAYVPEMERIARIHLAKWRAEGRFAWCSRLADFTYHLACSLIVGDERLLGLADTFQTWIQGLFSLPVPLPWARFGRAQRARAELIGGIEMTVRERLRDGISPGARDALSVLLSASDEHGEKLSVKELCDQLLTLLFAGHDTSSSALASFCLLVAQHPKVLSRLRAEQSGADLDGPLAIDMVERMPYLGQVVREVLRLVPPVGGGFRTVLTPCEFAGYRIPKGWRVHYQIHSTHRNDAHFAEPDSFDPDRFGPERAEDRHTRFALVPFGGGPRIGIGMEFARIEMLVLGSLLLRDYQWDIEPDQDLTIDSMPVPRPRSGLIVRFRPRAS